MALQKDKTLNNGVTVSYWKILNTNIDWYEQNIDICIGGFLDKATRDAGAKAIEIYYIYYGKIDFPCTVGGNNLSEIYIQIKIPIILTFIDGNGIQQTEETNFFADAINV